MAFGTRSSCHIFETFAMAMEWAVHRQSCLDMITHYLDDFFLANASFTGCQTLMQQFAELTEFVGAPLSPGKTEGPVMRLVFLGLVIDTVDQTISIPKLKWQQAVELIEDALNTEQGKITVKLLQQICGKLQFVTKGIPVGRAFLHRLYDMQKLALPVEKRFSIFKPNPQHHLKLSQGACKDLNTWLTFLLEEDHDRDRVVPFLWLLQGVCGLELYTDSAGSTKLGFRGAFKNFWTFGWWPLGFFKCRKPSIALLEFLAVVLAVDTWAEEMASSQVVVRSDNQAVIQFINKATSKCKWCMSLVRHLTFTCMRFQIHLVGVYFPGQANQRVDALSRLDAQRFKCHRQWYFNDTGFHLKTTPTPINSPLWPVGWSKLRM